MTRETAVTQKDDAVVLKARTVLSTSVNTELQVHQKKKVEYHEQGQYFLSLLSESDTDTHILYRFITHRVKYFKPLLLEIDCHCTTAMLF